MKVGMIVGRELKAYLRSPLGYVAAASVMLFDGLVFMVVALGGPTEKKLSALVLHQFFFWSSGAMAALAGLLACRVIAVEHESGSLVMLKTAPIRDWEIVIGKFLSVMAVVFAITAMTAYIPLLLMKNGKISMGHMLTGYLGLLLLGATIAAIAMFASALMKNQILAAIITFLIGAVMYFWWAVAKVADPPVQKYVEGLAIHHLRMKDFMDGVLRVENVVFYGAVTAFFLLASVKTLEARRWR
jgi:ABC-2 type transport system permease protein